MKKIMISLQMFFLHLAVMAGVTYLIRAVPLVLCRGEVSNRFLRSFLAYVPYAVLGAAGTITALVLAFCRKGLLTVALGACAASFLVKAVMLL